MNAKAIMDNAGGIMEAAKQRFRPWKAVIVAAMVSVVGGSLVYALYDYRCRIARHEDYCVRPKELRLVQTTTWMTPEIAAEIRSSLNELPERLSLMDPRSASSVAQCLERNPWVRKVYYVRLDSPQPRGTGNGLEVSMSFRRPVGCVQVGEGRSARYVLVDREGVCLSGEPLPEPLLGDRLLLVIDGVRSQPPRQGEVWNDAGVLAGAEVANVLRDHVTRFNLSRIDVANIGGLRDRRQPEIAIYTKRHATRILWGGPQNRKTETLEGTPQEKLRCLEQLADRLGGLDGRVEEIDLVERQLRRSAGGARQRTGVRG